MNPSRYMPQSKTGPRARQQQDCEHRPHRVLVLAPISLTLFKRAKPWVPSQQTLPVRESPQPSPRLSQRPASTDKRTVSRRVNVVSTSAEDAHINRTPQSHPSIACTCCTSSKPQNHPSILESCNTVAASKRVRATMSARAPVKIREGLFLPGPGTGKPCRAPPRVRLLNTWAPYALFQGFRMVYGLRQGRVSGWGVPGDIHH